MQHPEGVQDAQTTPETGKTRTIYQEITHLNHDFTSTANSGIAYFFFFAIEYLEQTVA